MHGLTNIAIDLSGLNCGLRWWVKSLLLAFCCLFCKLTWEHLGVQELNAVMQHPEDMVELGHTSQHLWLQRPRDFAPTRELTPIFQPNLALKWMLMGCVPYNKFVCLMILIPGKLLLNREDIDTSLWKKLQRWTGLFMIDCDILKNSIPRFCKGLIQQQLPVPTRRVDQHQDHWIHCADKAVLSSVAVGLNHLSHGCLQVRIPLMRQARPMEWGLARYEANLARTIPFHRLYTMLIK